MITKVFATGFKGREIDQELGRYTLFCGPNGSGKSARTQALTLACLGYLPQDQAKLPSVIHATHASAGDMEVGVVVDGKKFSRRYQEGKHEAFLDGCKVPQKSVEKVLFELGNPKILDLRAFNDLSDAGKIDYLLALFPPEGDLKTVEKDLGKLDEKEKRLRSGLKAARQVVERLTRERSGMELPAGTLAEVKAKVAETEKALAESRDDLKEEEAREREKKAADQATKEAVNKAKAEAEQKSKDAQKAKKEAEEKAAVKTTAFPIVDKPFPPVLVDAGMSFDDGVRKGIEALEQVKRTLVSAGCRSCAALIVVNSEIRKLEKEVHGHGNAESQDRRSAGVA